MEIKINRHNGPKSISPSIMYVNGLFALDAESKLKPIITNDAGNINIMYVNHKSEIIIVFRISFISIILKKVYDKI